MNNISGNAIPILITERPWGVSVVMLAPSVPCLRNFHPTTTFFFCEACFHHCADFSLYLFALSPLSLPSLSPLHASSTNPRCAFTPSAVSFLPFRFPIYPFRWLRFPLSLSLSHFRDIKPWFSRFDPTACHNTMARLQRRRQPRSFSSSIVGVNRAPSR